MTSIFTLEPRKDFQDLFNRTLQDLQSTKVVVGIEEQTMLSYLNRGLKYWPHRTGAKNMTDYLQMRGVEMEGNLSGRNRLLFLELVVNLLYWAPHQEEIDKSVEEEDTFSWADSYIRIESERILDDVAYLLEQCCNMWVRKEEADGFPKYFISKRDASVDAAVLAVPELANILLGYFDMRNENDEEFKKATLISLYNYMEPKRKTYKQLSCSSVSEEFFTALNTLNIRHNTDSQIRLEESERIELYDKLFLMASYVLQTENVNMIKDDVKSLRSGN